ncbi:MAG: pantoate--beta-alanine ligase, partial [Desulfovibrionales bacterium]
MRIVTHPGELQKLCHDWRCRGLNTALVPTMGFFHAGHCSLMRWARDNADRVVVSLFVNPTQFAPDEDLDKYPADRERDFALARKEGVDLLFAPEAGAMYAPGHETVVSVPLLSRGLCGRSRPTHFQGVATVVCKLFNLVLPQTAVFGEKDWQQ